MKNLLFIDTETTGLPSNYDLDYSNTNNWPRLVQIAWLLYNEEGVLLETSNFIIEPEGFDIPQEAIEIHKINNEKAINEGEELVIVLFKFLEVLSKSNFLIGHNINFDEKVVGCELFRKHFDISKLSLITKFCSMKNETVIKFCDLNGKRPTLNELYNKLFRENIANTHDALSDVNATSKCYFELTERGIIQLNKNSSTNISNINIIKPPQKKSNLTDWHSKDAIKNQINELPIVSSLKQTFKFENRNTINNNKNYEYDYCDDDNFNCDEDGFDESMLESIRDYEDDVNSYEYELEINVELKKQLDVFSLNWRKRFNEIVILNKNISIGKQIDKYYFLNANTGEFLSMDFFELIFVINDNTVIVKKDGKFGMMDSLLNIILPIDYSQITNYENTFFILLKFDTSNYILTGPKNTRYQLYHVNRFFILDSEYEEFSYFGHGLFKVKRINDHFNLMNVRGEHLFENSFFEVCSLDSRCPEYLIGKDRYTISIYKFNNDDNTILKLSVIQADDIFFQTYDKNGKLILKISKGEKRGLIDIQGNILTECIYQNFEYLTDVNLIKISSESGYHKKIYGLLDLNYKLVLPCEFTEIAPFLNGKSIVKVNGKVQIINLKGEIINNKKFEFASHVNENCMAFIGGNIETIRVGFIFKDNMKISYLSLGFLDNSGNIFLEEKWNLYYFKEILKKNICDEMLIYILTTLKDSINKYISFDQNCHSYTLFTEQILKSSFNINYNEIDYIIKEIKSGNVEKVKSKIF